MYTLWNKYQTSAHNQACMNFAATEFAMKLNGKVVGGLEVRESSPSSLLRGGDQMDKSHLKATYENNLKNNRRYPHPPSRC